jgi:hypothetical protein
MFRKLLEELHNIPEKESFFLDRTNKHIRLVQKAAAKIAEVHPEFKELVKQAEKHDLSKLEEPERTPYIELTWMKKTGEETKDKEDITQATLHHITTNSHHPEYHLKDKSDANINKDDRDKSDIDISLMPDIDIAEMVADWQAMAEELQTNTAREWFEKQKDVRWHFTEHQEGLISKLLEVFEE